MNEELNEFYKSLNEFQKKSLEPSPPIPHDEQSLIVFIDWLLQPPNHRIFGYKTTESIPRDINESFVRWLLRPPPYRAFCNKLLEISPKEFEGLIADLLRYLGGEVIPGARGRDEAIDLLWRTSKEDYIVQCKRWKNKVGIRVIREVYGAATKFQAKGAFVVTVSEFTDGATWFTKELSPRIGLIDGKELFKLMTQITPLVVADIIEGRRKENEK